MTALLGDGPNLMYFDNWWQGSFCSLLINTFLFESDSRANIFKGIFSVVSSPFSVCICVCVCVCECFVLYVMCGGVFDCICMGFCTFMYVRCVCVCVGVFVVVLYTGCMYVVDVCVVLNSLYVCVSFCFFKNLVGVSA